MATAKKETSKAVLALKGLSYLSFAAGLGLLALGFANGSHLGVSPRVACFKALNVAVEKEQAVSVCRNVRPAIPLSLVFSGLGVITSVAAKAHRESLDIRAKQKAGLG